MFQKVSCLDTANKLALFLFMYASAFYFYYKNRYAKAYRYAENALALDLDDSDKAPYLDSLTKLRADISKDMKRSRRL
jgi:hypothetical protein